MTTQKHRVSFSGSTGISFVAAVAVALVGCFGRPSTNVATMTCQQDVDCVSGYTCKVKGVPGGCCKPEDVNCGRLQDGATSTDGTRSIADSASDQGLAGDGPSGLGGDAGLGTGGAAQSGGAGGSVTADGSSGAGGATSTPDAPVLSDAPDAPTSLPTGSVCTTSGQCTSGLCVDGHCCDGKCDGNCESCVTGTCSFTSTPRKVCNGTGKCAGACDKSNTNACTYPDSSTVCGVQSCSGSQRTNKSLCDGQGNCPLQTKTTCDSNQCLADNSDCSGTCSAASCGAGKYCTGSTCAPLKNQGDSCSDKAECSTGNCVDGYCCESACTGTCTSCAVTHGKCTNTTSPRTGKACAGTAPCNASCTGSSPDCVPASTTTPCGYATCLSSTQLQLAGICNSQGTCSQSTQTCAVCLSTTNACADCTPGEKKCSTGTGGVPQHCDASGHWVNDPACGTGQVCSGAGSCVCQSGWTSCGRSGNTCYNSSSDSANCGSASGCQDCTTNGKTCSAGTCVCSGSKPNSCGTGCTNFNTDNSNCGTCGHACPAAQSCNGSGACVCPGTQQLCGTSCIDVLSSDLKNCGSCGHQCTPNQFCAVGTCQCNSIPIKCGTTPVCGTWGFESNTTEGWYLVTSQYSRVYPSTFGPSTKQAHSGTHSLAFQVSSDYTGTSSVGIQVCPSGTVTLNTITMQVYLEGGPSTAPENKSSGGLEDQLASDFTSPSAWSVGSWTQIGGSLWQTEVGTTFTLNLAIFDPNWSGWVYIDDVVMN